MYGARRAYRSEVWSNLETRESFSVEVVNGMAI